MSKWLTRLVKSDLLLLNIERVLSRIFPNHVRGERKSLREEVREWAEDFATDKNLDVEVRERREPVKRTVITMRGERSFVIAIHDPLGQVSPKIIPAESITGADYAVEFPATRGLDKFILVQLKRTSYGMPPSSYITIPHYAHYFPEQVDIIKRMKSKKQSRKNFTIDFMHAIEQST